MKKGFTLVELLAVIVILAVILVIAVPQINSVIKQTKINSLGSTAKLIAAKAEEKEVENQALEQNEELSCSSLVKLDDNYGNCSVTKVNGKWTVTLNGLNRFAGLKCTGTKEGMICTEASTPEYLYSFYTPYYRYEYEVTDSEACKNWLLYEHWHYSQGATINSSDENFSNRICGNSTDVEGDNSNMSTSDWFNEQISHNYFTYQVISSFVAKTGDGTLADAFDDYNDVLFKYNSMPATVFIRWPGNTINFDGNDPKAVCTTYNNTNSCFEVSESAYSTNVSNLETLFGSSNCKDGTQYIHYPDDVVKYTEYRDANSSYACRLYETGTVSCTNFHVYGASVLANCGADLESFGCGFD